MKKVIPDDWCGEITPDMVNVSDFDAEAELAAILQEEIWKEITAETGQTKQDLDNEIIAKLRSLVKGKI